MSQWKWTSPCVRSWKIWNQKNQEKVNFFDVTWSHIKKKCPWGINLVSRNPSAVAGTCCGFKCYTNRKKRRFLSGSFLSQGSIHICPCNKGTAVFVFIVMTKWTARSAIYQALILAHCSLMGSVFSIPCGLVVQQEAPQLNVCAGGKVTDAFTVRLYINTVCIYLRDSRWWKSRLLGAVLAF